MTTRPLPRIDDPRNYPEDFPGENGNYICNCAVCGNDFLGYKRRCECKLCRTKREAAQ